MRANRGSSTTHTHGANPRRGATTVEVALTFPILMLVIFSSIDAARLNTLRNSVECAAYEGARRAIIPGATKADVDEAAGVILRSISARDAVITTNPAVITASATSITVTIDVPLDSNSWLGKSTSRHMIRSCTLSRERTL